MDRSSFLASLPFLIRLPSPAWPPSSYETKMVILAGDHSYGSFQLSMECGGPQQQQQKKPAFFATSTSNTTTTTAAAADAAANSTSGTTPAASVTMASTAATSDPAQTPIELILCNKQSIHQDQDLDQKDDECDISMTRPVTAFLRAEGYVYAMNLSAIGNMIMFPETFQPAHHSSFGSSKIATPPCLVLDFGGSSSLVQFRLFRTTGTADDCTEDRAFWNGVRKTLGEAIANASMFCVEPILDGASVPSSPERSTNTTCTSGSRTTTEGTASSKIFKHNLKRSAAVAAAVEVDNDLHHQTLHHRHKAARQCREHLERIRHVLELPAQHFIDPNGDTSSIMDDMNDMPTTTTLPLGPLLTQTADLWPAAYASANELNHAAQHWDAMRREAQEQIQITLQGYFPTAPPRRRRHQQQQQRQRQQLQQHQQSSNTVSWAAAVASLEEQLERHKQATEEQYKLLLLPQRG